MKFLKILLSILICFATIPYAFSEERTPQRTLTLLYSNNINGETDPCPT